MATPFDYFQMEAEERLDSLSTGLLALEKSPRDKHLIDDLFREAHSLKGAAGVTGLTVISDVCHAMEDLLGDVRDGSRAPGAAMIDALLAATDAVRRLLAAQAENSDCDVTPADIIETLRLQRQPSPAGDSRASIGSARAASDARPPKARVSTVHAPQPPTTESVRVEVNTLETLADRSGELLVAVDRLQQRQVQIKQLFNTVRRQCDQQVIGSDVQRLLQPVAVQLRELMDDCKTDSTIIDPLVEEIHDRMLDTQMLPLSVVFDQLPRFVRDHCRQEDKQAELLIDGADIRVDRYVLEQLRDPMIHLIRNAVSHGIEPPGDRERCGKEGQAVIRISTSRNGGRIQISCEDDGRGIERDKVLAKALGAGLLDENQAAEMEPHQVDRLVLHPGLSTSDMITDVCGRGVGMDAVLSKIEGMGGSLTIASEPGLFTRFIMDVPASVATIHGLLVVACGHTYIVPTASVIRTHAIKITDIQHCGGTALVNIEGQCVPLQALSNLLECDATDDDGMDIIPVVVVAHRDRHLALAVERLLGARSIVCKALGEDVGSIRGVVGATILGDGLPALIIEPSQLVRDYRPDHLTRALQARDTESAAEAAPVLVVDDSITTRMMEQSILEASGYNVDTAVSAEDALARIEHTNYRLFVVDVEMPGLNGFQLTRKLREDERFAETPIVIVTSLSSKEHRREGLEAGANAYIVKGDFDQNDLLATVDRLVG